MSKVTMGTVIAERTLHSANLDREVKVTIGCPQSTSNGDFITPYQITGVGDERIRFAAGLDAVQSLQLVFQMIGADVHHGLGEYALEWAGGDDPGFPKP